MQKSGGFIALLLIVTILFMPSSGNTPAIEQAVISSQAVCGNTTAQSDTLPQDDSENGMTEIIAILIAVIVVIIFIGYISNTEMG